MADEPALLDRYRLHADICKVLTDPKRLLLLAALRDGDRTVGDLAAAIGSALPNVSQHLAVLRTAGLVDGRREGAVVRYRLAEPAILDACDIVDGIVARQRSRRAGDQPAAALSVQATAGPANFGVSASSPSGTSSAASAPSRAVGQTPNRANRAPAAPAG